MGLLLNRVKATTATTGTGAVTPGAAVSPYQSWSAGGATTGFFYSYLIEDGSAWEIGVGLYNGTTVTRPGPGVDPQFASSTAALLNLSGSATISSVANKNDLSAATPFMPPLSGYFPTLIGTATPTLTDDAGGGLLIDMGSPVATDAIRGAVKTITTPTADYTAICKVNVDTVYGNFCGLGMLLYNSANARVIYFTLNPSAAAIIAVTYNSYPTGFNSNPITGPTYWQLSVWLKVDHSGAGNTLTFSFSVDGKKWYPLGTLSDTAWLTGRPTSIGVGGVYNRASGQVYGSYTYWWDNA